MLRSNACSKPRQSPSFSSAAADASNARGCTAPIRAAVARSAGRISIWPLL